MLKDISFKDNGDFFQKTLKTVKLCYDSEKMIQMIIGENWRDITDVKRSELTEVFEKYITYNYLKMFAKISNPSFEEGNEKKIGDNYKLVKTFLIIGQNEKIEINYLLLKKKKGWKILDVLLAGSVSEIATKKSEFSKYLNSGNIDELINALKKVIKL